MAAMAGPFSCCALAPVPPLDVSLSPSWRYLNRHDALHALVSPASPRPGSLQAAWRWRTHPLAAAGSLYRRASSPPLYRIYTQIHPEALLESLPPVRNGKRHCKASSSDIGEAMAAEDDLPLPVLQKQVRIRVVALVAMALFLCNADRTIMAVAVLPLSATHGWPQSVAGIVQSSFLFGYLLTPIVGGALADRYGGRNVLAMGIGLWSSATLATPWAAQHSLQALVVVRALMGLGEGVALPCMNNLVGRWVPPAERARAVGACFAGFHFGSMGGLLTAPLLMASVSLGVTGPFLVFGIFGYIWLMVWLLTASTSPSTHPHITTEELHYITNKQSGGREGDAHARYADAGRRVESGYLPADCTVDKLGLESSGIQTRSSYGGSLADGTSEHAKSADKERKWPPFALLLSKWPTWALIVANVVNNWGYFIMLSWMPTYFNKVFGLSVRNAAWFSAAPWAVMAAAGILAGSMADSLISRRVISTTAVRKLMQSIGFIGPSVALLALAGASSAAWASFYLTVALGLSAFSQAGFLVNYQDIGPKYAGVLHGLSNTAGTLGGMASVLLAGVLVERLGSFQAVLRIAAAAYLAGALFWNVFATGTRVFD